jgi:hypothetical protein
MCAGAEMDGSPVEADQLGEAQACLGREQQQGVIAPSEPCRAIESGKDRLDLGSRQELDLALVVALARYREDSLDKGAAGRLLEGHEPEEGANGRQAQVARPDAGAPLRLEIGKEGTDERHIQIVEGQGRRGLAQPRLCKPEQQPECVLVGCDRVGADIALSHEPLGEVMLDKRGDVAARLHRLTSHRRSRRRAAASINSGQAERYQ